MSAQRRVQALNTLIATLDALADRHIRRALITTLQTHARQRYLRIDTISMNTNLSDHLKDFYYAEQVRRFAEQLIDKPFWWVGLADEGPAMLYETHSGLLWEAIPEHDSLIALRDAQSRAKLLILYGLGGWSLPRKKQLIDFATSQHNPLRSGSHDRLLNQCFWLCRSGRIDLDSTTSSVVEADSLGAVIACNQSFFDTPPEAFIKTAVQRGWNLRPYDEKNSKNSLASLQKIPDLITLYSPIDWLSARLPRLESAQFTDPNKGLWEFWGQHAEDLRETGVRARNPTKDLKDWNIAIDFGTNSTVVAYDENGQLKLLRIGVQDFWDKEESSDYENPTILEFIDLATLLDVWREEAYRPCVRWGEQVRCSHEALDNLRHNASDPSVVASMLAKLKQWALREDVDAPLRITDQANGVEHELELLTQRMPVKGQPLTVSVDDPFDPIELYAWFLGLTINWRGRGLFLRYYMTFPVAYPREVKDKILASFRRGLQRSLPATIVDQPEFADFAVEELASEPAAYAAAALPLLDIVPTAEGIAYAVFDFGGGTTDFDFGRYRLPDAGEDNEGWEAVFEHFDVAGDPFLGGENLLESLAYRTFQHNLDLCREHRIAFTCPLDADDFPGSEMFLERTQAAQTNTLMLMSRLRPFWEQGRMPDSSGVEKLALLKRDGGKVTCELAIPESLLSEYLETRIEQGVNNFLVALHKAFADQPPEQIHVLLAGNASRSPIVLRLFGLERASVEESERRAEGVTEAKASKSTATRFFADRLLGEAVLDRSAEANQVAEALQETAVEIQSTDPLHLRFQDRLQALFGQPAPVLQPHPPLPVEPKALYRPTAKTGVALGLLRLCPGGVVKVINHAAIASGGEAPFAFYVGRERLGRFQVGLQQGSSYGEWHELGTPRNCVFNLYYSQLPSAQTGELRIGESGLYRRRLDLSGDLSGHKVFARALGPDQLEICTSTSSVAIGDGLSENKRTFKLE